jgi:sugar phosphate isomerase/epimerase
MSIQLAVSIYALHRWRREQHKTLEDTIDFVAAQGVAGIEFSGIGDDAVNDPIARAHELRAKCDACGLRVPSYCMSAELFGDPAQQAEQIQSIKQGVDIAAILGARSMRHDVTWNPEAAKISFSDFLANVVPACREVTQYARSKGIKTSLENHGTFLQTADRIETLVKAIDDTNFGVTLDMGNFLCLNQDPVESVRRLLPYAVMVHAKDFHVRAKETMPKHGWFATPTPIALRGAILGHGMIDVPAQIALLKQADYSGWLSLEFEGMEEPTTAVKMGLEFLRELVK